MADASSGEKSEEPTAKRRSKFRSEGQVPVSRDVSGVVGLAAGMATLAYAGTSAWAALTGALREAFAALPHRGVDADPAAVLGILGPMGAAFLTAAGPVIAASALGGVAVSLAQTGGNVTGKAMRFKPERFNPVQGLKRLFASLETLQQIGLGLAKAVVLGTALWLVLRRHLAALAATSRVPLTSGVAIVLDVIVRLVVVSLLASAALAAIDYFLVRRRLHTQMKMTKQEVKDEHKQAEGNPHIKGRMRARMRQIGRNRMIAATRNADVVVVNPTHYAVALAYDPDKDGAPRMISKGKDALAGRIRAIARAHQIPIVAHPPVARALYAVGRPGREIPPEAYEMVAKLLAYLYRLKRGQAAA
jgi:flagellar biosynthetic protein FlhB